MMTISRTVIVTLLVLTAVPHEVIAFGRLNAKPQLAAVSVQADAKPLSHLAVIVQSDAGHRGKGQGQGQGQGQDGNVGAIVAVGGNDQIQQLGEAQYTDIALGDLEATEAMMTDALKNITTAKAVEVVIEHGAPSELRALIKNTLGKKKKADDEVQKGQDMLNEMIQETLEKLDLERQTCALFIKSQTQAIWLTNQAIRKYDAAAAGAKEAVLGAQTNIGKLSKLLPELTTTLAQHNRKCTEDIAGTEAELKLVLGDIEVMAGILKMTECKQALLGLSHVLLRKDAARVKSSQARQMVGEGLDDACTDKIPLEPQTDGNSPLGNQLQEAPDPSADKEAAKCTLSQSNCGRLRDKFLKIQAGMTAKRDELTASLNSVTKHCDETRANLEGQISDGETDLKGQQTNLAKGTKEQNDAERNSKIKNEEKVGLTAELTRMTALCKANIGNLVGEKCALGKIRGELENMKGNKEPPFLVDCEVSDWAASECSKSCNGGVQQLTRSVAVQPMGGAKCPPLAMERACNEDPCPVDCVMEDWTEWGACSAECNSGVKQKVRNIVTEPENGGNPCGETSIGESCNVGSCDKPCILGEWTVWSACSKECDSGLKSRAKSVMEKSKGEGECAPSDHDSRLEYMPCNVVQCRANVTCETPLDVILLLDGSSSAGKSGFEMTKMAGEMFLSRLDKNFNKVSLIVYSGPSDFLTLAKCTAGGQEGEAPPDMKKDCGINVVEHFTDDMAAVTTKIQGLEYPGKSALVSQALMAAKTEFSLGRQDASSVVVVFGHGKPMNFERTSAAAKDIREAARLMWVQVENTNLPAKQLTKWVSNPKADNLIEVPDYEALANIETIDYIVAALCPAVNQPGQCNCIPCGTHAHFDYEAGSCGVESPTCSASKGSADDGCYTKAEGACNCVTRDAALPM